MDILVIQLAVIFWFGLTRFMFPYLHIFNYKVVNICSIQSSTNYQRTKSICTAYNMGAIAAARLN